MTLSNRIVEFLDDAVERDAISATGLCLFALFFFIQIARFLHLFYLFLFLLFLLLKHSFFRLVGFLLCLIDAAWLLASERAATADALAAVAHEFARVADANETAHSLAALLDVERAAAPDAAALLAFCERVAPTLTADAAAVLRVTRDTADFHDSLRRIAVLHANAPHHSSTDVLRAPLDGAELLDELVLNDEELQLRFELGQRKQVCINNIYYYF